MSTTMTQPKTPLSERINVRMLVILAVVAILVGYPVYLFVSASINGGAQRSGDVWNVDLKSLGNFPFDEQRSTIAEIPEKWRKLDGQKVSLEGFMYAGNSAGDDVSAFQFVYNISKCCFNGPPLVQERVFMKVPDGKTVPYYGQMVRCVGTLHVAVNKNDAGKASSIYDMELQKVEPL